MIYSKSKKEGENPQFNFQDKISVLNVTWIKKIHEYIPQNLTYLHQMEVFYHPRENTV